MVCLEVKWKGILDNSLNYTEDHKRKRINGVW